MVKGKPIVIPSKLTPKEKEERKKETIRIIYKILTEK